MLMIIDIIYLSEKVFNLNMKISNNIGLHSLILLMLKEMGLLCNSFL